MYYAGIRPTSPVTIMTNLSFARSLVLVLSAMVCGSSIGQDSGSPTELFSTGFSDLADGDFPPALVFKGGGMQIDSSQGDSMLRFQGGSWFHVELGAELPERFAIEFSYFTNEYNSVLYVSPFDSAVSGTSPPSYSGYRQVPFNFFALANTVVGIAIDSSSEALPKANVQNNAFTQGVVQIRIEVRGRQSRVFVNGEQTVIHPAATFSRTNVVEFFYASVGSPGNGYLGDIRIVAI